jgi:hypothetical protein
MKTCCLYFFILIIGISTLISCQKELDGLTIGGTVIPANQKPKVGTTWTYRYYTYYSYGPLATAVILTYKAKSEETIGGEKWLRIVDMGADTTVYLMNTKPDGLYHYTNSNAYLLCKYPAAINDTYTTFNDGSVETFTVKGVNDTLATGIGDIPLNYYEGVKSTYLIDLIWYNTYAWIVWETRYFKSTDPPIRYYLYSKMYLDNITY